MHHRVTHALSCPVRSIDPLCVYLRCDTKCTPFTQVPGTDGAIAKDAESTAVVGLGNIEKVTAAACVYIMVMCIKSHTDPL